MVSDLLKIYIFWFGCRLIAYEDDVVLMVKGYLNVVATWVKKSGLAVIIKLKYRRYKTSDVSLPSLGHSTLSCRKGGSLCHFSAGKCYAAKVAIRLRKIIKGPREGHSEILSHLPISMSL